MSILMPVYNDAEYLPAAIESVVTQTFGDFELLIVDDGSTDASRSVAERYADPRIRVTGFASNRGLTQALNHGLALCRGEYVARLDADDLSFPARLERQVAWLDAHPDVAVLGSQSIAIDSAGRPIRRVPLTCLQWRKPAGGEALRWFRMFDTPFVHSAVMFRRRIVVALGGYDEHHPLEQDAELWMRIGASHGLANLDEALGAFRLGPRSMTGDPARRERLGYAERKTKITHRLLCDGLQTDDVPIDSARLWVKANDAAERLTLEEVRQLIAAIRSWASRFDDLHPAASSNPAIARHRVSVFARVAEKAALTHRTTACGILGTMLRYRPSSAVRTLPRIAAVLLFGDAPFRFQERRRAASR